jgi:hypothetical protein
MTDFKLPIARFASLPLPLMDSNPSGPSRRLGLKLECWKFALPPEALGGIWAASSAGPAPADNSGAETELVVVWDGIGSSAN